MRVRLRKGLDVVLTGAPAPTPPAAKAVSSVALLGADYPGLRAADVVAEGAHVAPGQTLFVDKKNPRVRFTAPVGGRVSAVVRGAKRRLEAVVVDVDVDAETAFEAGPAARDRADTVDALCASGLWTALRRRPFGTVADPDTVPAALFVTAIDSAPLAPPPEVVIAEEEDAFAAGLDALARLTDGPVHLCTAPGADVPTGTSGRVAAAVFDGPHPAGLPGTHIHFLAPAGPARTVWHVGYQDVIAVGCLFTEGRLMTERTVALTGPRLTRPRLVRAPLGASLDDLLAGELDDGPKRVVSGSVVSGRRADGTQPYLGRYHTQVTAVAADAPGAPGAPGVMVGLEALDAAMPLDILAGPLMRALLTGDTEAAARLGCLELIEEDVALLTHQCASGNDYGALLRRCLDALQREGAA